MDQRIQSASIIAAALLRDKPNPGTEKIAELLSQALEALDIATGLENKRMARKAAALKMNVIGRRPVGTGAYS
jgi:hypothetical protein